MVVKVLIIIGEGCDESVAGLLVHQLTNRLPIVEDANNVTCPVIPVIIGNDWNDLYNMRSSTAVIKLNMFDSYGICLGEINEAFKELPNFTVINPDEIDIIIIGIERTINEQKSEGEGECGEKISSDGGTDNLKTS